MKKLSLTAAAAAVALTVAAPAFAQSQLELSVGADAGQYSLPQLVQLKAARDNSGNEATVYFQTSPVDVSSNSRHSVTALRIFEELSNENQGDRE